jgi:hypothetical protein
MADNLSVTLAPPPLALGNVAMQAGRVFQFSFTNQPGASFSVLATADAAQPRTNWGTLGNAAEIAPGVFQFTDSDATNRVQRFYSVSSP